MIPFFFRWVPLGCLCWVMLPAWGQTQTVGTFLNAPEAFDGYTLLDPMGSTNTHLINNCGEVVQTWTSDYNSGGACYLLEDGSLARGCRVMGAFAGGGIGGRLERMSWDGELEWWLDWADDTQHHHHDFAWMPNGHVLVLAWELKTQEEAAEAGRVNPQLMWPESITEIAPTLPSGGEVVWEWHAWDHLVQNVDPSLANHGEPSDHPHRIDVNYANVGGGGGPGGANSGDWMHANAVNYNASLDHIAISSRRFNEIWIIDHNTTTEQATGPAGDILYRYGNPEAYGRGSEEDRMMFGQHDVQWIPEGHPQAGDLVIYNNGAGRPGCECSSIDVWSPPFEDGAYPVPQDDAFGPETWLWSYPEVLNASFYSSNISGVQPQPNGNFLICQGANGRLFEVTQTGDIVWEYINPEGNFGVSIQGSNPQQNNVFRAYRYAPSYPGFEGRDLTPGEPLEGLGEFTCDLFPADTETSSTDVASWTDVPVLGAHPNPANHVVTLRTNVAGLWTVRNAMGQSVAHQRVLASESLELGTADWPAGMYFATLNTHDSMSHTLRLSIGH